MINNEDREAIVNYRLENAHKTLAEITIHIQNELWNTAISRLYYSCYYAVSALLIKSGIETQTHSAVRRMLSLHFVKTGKLSAEWSKFYTDLFENRQTGDYADFVNFDRQDVEDFYNQAVSFVDIITELINS
jgi:uncharacterized protein (UPF0332 family)